MSARASISLLSHLASLAYKNPSTSAAPMISRFSIDLDKLSCRNGSGGGGQFASEPHETINALTSDDGARKDERDEDINNLLFEAINWGAARMVTQSTRGDFTRAPLATILF